MSEQKNPKPQEPKLGDPGITGPLNLFQPVNPISSPTPIPTLLSDLLAGVPIAKTRQYFLRKRINLDSLRFEECRFDDCELYTNTGQVYLRDCVFGGDTKIIFGPNAQKIVQLASMVDAKKAHPSLFAKLEKVGNFTSVTIDDQPR